MMRKMNKGSKVDKGIYILSYISARASSILIPCKSSGRTSACRKEVSRLSTLKSVKSATPAKKIIRT